MTARGANAMSEEASSKGTGSELRALLRLATPLAALQLALGALGAVGMMVVGRIGDLEILGRDVPASTTAGLRAAVEQGAAGLGNMFFFVLVVLGMGVVLGFDPLISQAIGAKENTRAARLTIQAGWMGVLVGSAIVLVAIGLAIALPSTNLDPESASSTRSYLLARSWSIVPFLISSAARAFLQARGKLRPLLVGALWANLVNLPLSWLLVLGDDGLNALGLPQVGLPAYGALGAGLANGVATLVMSLVLVLYARRETNVRFEGPKKELLRDGFRVGAPLSLQLTAEVGAFTLVSYIAGTLGAAVLASHEVAITLVSLPFQVSIALNESASVRVGLTTGEGIDPLAPRRAGFTALGVGLLLSSLSALLFAVFPEWVAGLLTSEPEVIETAASLIRIAAMFQLVDGLQAISAGALRGIGDTRASMISNLCGHFALGIPLGLFLCFSHSMGARGLWWGLSAGLAMVAILLVARFERLTRRGVARL